jgi:hypothetical protein
MRRLIALLTAAMTLSVSGCLLLEISYPSSSADPNVRMSQLMDYGQSGPESDSTSKQSPVPSERVDGAIAPN